MNASNKHITYRMLADGQLEEIETSKHFVVADFKLGNHGHGINNMVKLDLGGGQSPPPGAETHRRNGLQFWSRCGQHRGGTRRSIAPRIIQETSTSSNRTDRTAGTAEAAHRGGRGVRAPGGGAAYNRHRSASDHARSLQEYLTP